MANETKIIEIDVKIDNAVKQIAQLQQTIAQLNIEQKTLNKENGISQEQYAKNTVALNNYNQQLREVIKETANVVKIEQQQIGHIESLEKQVSNLTLEYKRLTESELNSAKGQQVLTALKDKRTELAKLEQAYGNYSKNVGNYASATNMLAINVGQVLKEAPNFAISARIGIMSLTNNLPMLAEAIKAVRLEQVEARKAQEAMTAAQIAALPNGGKLPSMFSLITKSIFGLTGIMSIAMVLFQVFGEDIIKWVSSLFKANDAVATLNKTLGELNKDVFEGLKNDTERIIRFSLQYNKAVRDGNKERISDLEKIGKKEYGLSDERLKMIANNVNAWRSAFNDYLSKARETYMAESRIKMGVELELANKLASETQNRLLKQIRQGLPSTTIDPEGLIKKVQSGENPFAFWSKSSKLAKEFIDLSQQVIDNNQKLANLNKVHIKESLLLDDKSFQYKGRKAKELFDFETELMQLKSDTQRESLDQELLDIQAWNNKKKTEYSKSLKDHTLTQNQYAELLVNLQNATLEKTSKAFYKYITKDDEAFGKGMKSAIDSVNKQIDDWYKFRKESRKKEKEIWDVEIMKAETDLIIAQTKGQDTLEEQRKLNNVKKQAEQAEINNNELLTKDTKDAAIAKSDAYWKNVDEEATKDNLIKKTDMYVNYANAVYNIASNISSFMSQLEESELANYAKTIKGKANYDELYDKKKLEIERRAAIRTKALGVFNATVSTAEAVIKALSDKSLPGPAGVAMAIAAGVTGLAEIATILATPLPTASSTGSNATTTSTVTEKIGGGSMSSVLSAVTSGGGTANVTSGVGNVSSISTDMKSAFKEALSEMPAPVMSWTEYETQAQRQQKLKNNRIIQ